MVKLEDALNKTSKNCIIPYPPGIPIVLAGETISKEIIKKLNVLIKNNVNILGIEDNSIYIKKIKNKK